MNKIFSIHNIPDIPTSNIRGGSLEERAESPFLFRIIRSRNPQAVCDVMYTSCISTSRKLTTNRSSSARFLNWRDRPTRSTWLIRSTRTCPSERGHEARLPLCRHEHRRVGGGAIPHQEHPSRTRTIKLPLKFTTRYDFPRFTLLAHEILSLILISFHQLRTFSWRISMRGLNFLVSLPSAVNLMWSEMRSASMTTVAASVSVPAMDTPPSCK